MAERDPSAWVSSGEDLGREWIDKGGLFMPLVYRTVGTRCVLILALLSLLVFGSLLSPLTPKAFAIDPSADIELPVGTLLGDGPDRAWAGVGAFNVFPNNSANRSAQFSGEYRPGYKLFSIGPMLGLTVNTQGGVFGYGGLYTDYAVGPVVLTPSVAVGGYAQNGSKDLGSVFQIQTAFEAAYQFEGGSRLGVRISHISNLGVNEKNPGAESLLLTYSLPLRW